MSDGRPVRVATVITRLDGGAGQHALRGARAMDPAGYAMTIITGRGGLVAEAEAAGLEVIVEPSLRAPIAPGSDLRALAVGFLLDSPDAAARMAATARARLGTRFGEQALRGALVAAYSGGYAVA